MKPNIYSILLALFGQAIIIAGFLLFRGDCPDNILWLDIVISSVVFWLMGWSFGMEPFSLTDHSSRKAGGLGIKWVSSLTYSICAVGFMIACGIAGHSEDGIPFKWQLIIQAGLIFLLLLGLLSSTVASEKAEEVYLKDCQTRQGKEDIRFALSVVAREAEANRSLPPGLASRIRRISDESRYISPSGSRLATETDSRILSLADRLRGAVYGNGVNPAEINNLVDTLERELSERKRAF